MEAGAAWQDLTMGVREWSAWERIALVTDHAWMRDGLRPVRLGSARRRSAPSPPPSAPLRSTGSTPADHLRDGVTRTPQAGHCQRALYSSSSRRPMIIFWISAVPSPMSSIGASR